MNTRIIRRTDYKTTRWSGGVTHQLYIYPENAEYASRNFLFRISMAQAEVNESDYTYLEGVDRYLVSLDGECVLSHENGEKLHLSPFDTVAHFSGGIKTHASGAIRDFNLMLKDGAKGEMTVADKRIYVIDKLKAQIFIYSDGKADITIDTIHKFSLNEGEMLVITEAVAPTVKITSCTKKLIICVVET